MNTFLASAILLVGFVLSANFALARETRLLSLDEKVSASDAIFIGKIISIEDPDPSIPGVERYVVVQVEQVLLGRNFPQTVQFVIKGFSQELDPLCCQKKRKYLFFAHRGFEIFDFNPEGAVIIRREENRFYSATNGPYSTYLIKRGCMIGWPDQSGHRCIASVQKVSEEVKAAIRRNEILHPQMP